MALSPKKIGDIIPRNKHKTISKQLSGSQAGYKFK